ncbi:hypothetical protein HY468_03705 [Candidatus Roizmanbacteria bacterium]|nr:hypothetical protein [Candidatus Roizmanbacteria bacterium]
MATPEQSIRRESTHIEGVTRVIRERKDQAPRVTVVTYQDSIGKYMERPGLYSPDMYVELADTQHARSIIDLKPQGILVGVDTARRREQTTSPRHGHFEGSRPIELTYDETGTLVHCILQPEDNYSAVSQDSAERQHGKKTQPWRVSVEQFSRYSSTLKDDSFIDYIDDLGAHSIDQLRKQLASGKPGILKYPQILECASALEKTILDFTVVIPEAKKAIQDNEYFDLFLFLLARMRNASPQTLLQIITGDTREIERQLDRIMSELLNDLISANTERGFEINETIALSHFTPEGFRVRYPEQTDDLDSFLSDEATAEIIPENELSARYGETLDPLYESTFSVQHTGQTIEITLQEYGVVKWTVQVPTTIDRSAIHNLLCDPNADIGEIERIVQIAIDRPSQ